VPDNSNPGTLAFIHVMPTEFGKEQGDGKDE
jgi:hypothetical protein